MKFIVIYYILSCNLEANYHAVRRYLGFHYCMYNCDKWKTNWKSSVHKKSDYHIMDLI